MEKKYFYCYSYKLMKFLALLGDKYEYAGKHPNGNTFWAFRSSKTLNKHLDNWRSFKEIAAE